MCGLRIVLMERFQKNANVLIKKIFVALGFFAEVVSRSYQFAINVMIAKSAVTISFVHTLHAVQRECWS